MLALVDRTRPGPFRWEGKHYHFRHVNPWCLPLQKPHPPIWVPGTASPETAVWAGRMGYTYVPFLVSFEVARELFDFYRQGAAEAGRTVTEDKLGFWEVRGYSNTADPWTEDRYA